MSSNCQSDNTSAAQIPPRLFWLIPAVVIALRMVPFLLTRLIEPPEGKVLPAVGYNPIDWFAYAAFTRHAAETGDWLLSNPYASMPQTGRFIMPLFSVLGHVVRWTGLDVFWAIELSRVPLTFLFFAVLWWFLAPLVADVRKRLMTIVLVAFSGGLELLVLPTVNRWPLELQTVGYQALSDDQGWNTFAALYNPLWIAGLTCTLIALRPVVQPGGPQNLTQWAQTSIGYAITHLVHPYSGLVVLAVICANPVLRLLIGVTENLKAQLAGLAKTVIPAVLVVASISWWQNQDPVYRTTAARVLGNNPLSVFWYPATLGVLLVLVLRGSRYWLANKIPGRLELLAWIAAVVFMHNSPLFNGHHYVFHLHLPLCIVATCAFDRLWHAAHNETPTRQIVAALALAALFQSPIACTFRAVKNVLNYQVPAPAMAALDRLAKLPAGIVYTSPHIGTLVPAYTPHRTYLGHWFMTPDYRARQNHFNEVVAGHADPTTVIEFFRKEHIDYVLLPPSTSPALLNALGTTASEITDLDHYTLVRLR